MRRLLPILAGVGLAVAAPGAAATGSPTTFAGGCKLTGPIKPKPPITIVPRPGPRFDYDGSGTCSGGFDGASTAGIRAALVFRDAGTIFDTCELGPDFPLHGNLVLSAGGRERRFAITVDLVRVLIGGPFALTTAGGGRASGIAQFMPRNAATAPAQCGTTGVADASLTASFSTTAALHGVLVPLPPARRPRPHVCRPRHRRAAPTREHSAGAHRC